MENSQQRKKRKSLGRKNEVKFRLTDGELKIFKSRVKKSGLPQGEFLRSAAITGQEPSWEESNFEKKLLVEFAFVRKELRQLCEQLKKFVKPNGEKKDLAPDEWAEFINIVRKVEQERSQLTDLEVKIARGNYKASNK